MRRSVGHWLRVGLASGVLTCTAIGIGAAPAGAQPRTASQFATSLIHVGDDCTYYNSGVYSGRVTLLRLGNHMMILVSLSHAVPNSTYPLELFQGGFETFCDHTVSLGRLHTNGQGTASGFFVPAITPYAYDFFLGSFNARTGWNESSLFFLPTPSRPFT